jgi:hypothetical protein
MSWIELQPDGRYRFFRCWTCKRLGCTGAAPGMKPPGPEVLGKCVCTTKGVTR